MTFLAPWLAASAAAIAVPLLVLLYFLKLRRREMPISSTLLWTRAVQDLQVNAPFQHLRKNLLLLLQVLVLIAGLLALSGPVLLRDGSPAKRYVLLIDRSASMNATDVLPSRLEVAKDEAGKLVATMRTPSALSLASRADEAMVVAFDEHARVMCNFTSDKRQLLSAIAAITPGDGGTRIDEAILMAKAFGSAPGEAANARGSGVQAQLELFSDGRLGDAAAHRDEAGASSRPAADAAISLQEGELAFHAIGSGGQNVGVTAMQARRGYENPQEVEVYATVANFGTDLVTCDAQLSLDGAIQSVQSVQLPPTANDQPGVLSLTFALEMPTGGVLELRCLPKSSQNFLGSDDAAWAVLPPPRNLAVCLVTDGNGPLLSALKACPLERLEVKSPAEFDAIDFGSLPPEKGYDVIVLDRHAPAKLPRGRFVVFGSPPAASGATATGSLENQVVLDWHSNHPILQYVNMANLFAAKAYKLSLPADSSVLAEFASAPALALVRNQGSLFLLAPFDCLETNWPFEPSFVMFCYNALGFLSLDGTQTGQLALPVGAPFSLEGLPTQARGVVTGPGATTAVQVNASGILRFPGTGRVGVYRLELANLPATTFAVNLLSAQESDIKPATRLAVGNQQVLAQAAQQKGNLELWPWLILLGLVGILLEWWVYSRKLRL